MFWPLIRLPEVENLHCHEQLGATKEEGYEAGGGKALWGRVAWGTREYWGRQEMTRQLAQCLPRKGGTAENEGKTG